MKQSQIKFPVNGPPIDGYATDRISADALSERQALAAKQLLQALRESHATFFARWKGRQVPVDELSHVLYWLFDQYADQVEKHHGQEKSS